MSELKEQNGSLGVRSNSVVPTAKNPLPAVDDEQGGLGSSFQS